MQLMTLSCPKCGASLDVPDGVEALSCKFCGSRSIVRETASIRALQLMREDLQGVRSDVESLVRSRQSQIDQWADAEFSLFVEHERQVDHARKHAVVGVPLVIVGALSLIAGLYFWAMGQAGGLYLFIGTALLILGAVKWALSKRCQRLADELAERIEQHKQHQPA